MEFSKACKILNERDASKKTIREYLSILVSNLNSKIQDTFVDIDDLVDYKVSTVHPAVIEFPSYLATKYENQNEVDYEDSLPILKSTAVVLIGNIKVKTCIKQLLNNYEPDEERLNGRRLKKVIMIKIIFFIEKEEFVAYVAT